MVPGAETAVQDALLAESYGNLGLVRRRRGGIDQPQIGVDHLVDHLLEALRGAPTQFPPDLARVTSLLWRIDRTLKPGIDVDESTPVGDANTPERGRDELSNRVAFAARDDEVIGCRVAPDQLKRACVSPAKPQSRRASEVADA